jgi:2-dehydropantoate 2-reductase
MRILVVGAGAVGGYFGARLAEAGRDVTFLVRKKRAAQLKEKGLQIVSPCGDVALRPKTTIAGDITSPFDVVLVSVKSYALAGAIDDFTAAVGPDTIIVPLLNGMRHLDILIDRFARERVLGGFCMVSAVLDDDGRVRHLTSMQSLAYGELDGRITPRLQKLHETIHGAGFDAHMSDRILADMWTKWVRLATLGALNCLLRGDIGEIASAEQGPAVASAMLSECLSIASACGYPQPGDVVEQQSSQLIARDSRLTASMYRDMKAGGPVEADTILGDFLQRGQQHGLAAPLLRAAFVTLSIYQRAREHGDAASD